MEKIINVVYFARIRDLVGKDEEKIETMAECVIDFYKELINKYSLKLDADNLFFAVNDSYVDKNFKLSDGDKFVIITQVAGG